MKISIIIPVYNEVRTLPELLRRVASAPMPHGCTREIIVVDDGSEDGSGSILDAPSDGMVVLRNDQNCGKGAAIRKGLSAATGDVILIQDGDLEYDPSDYPALLAPIVEGKAEVVYGSRFLGKAQGMRLRNRVANFALTATTNVLYGANLSDLATGYKAFRRELLGSVNLRCTRFDFCAEVTAKMLRLGIRIHEVPINYSARTIAEGKKIRATDGLLAIGTLLKCRFIPSRRIQMDTVSRPGVPDSSVQLLQPVDLVSSSSRFVKEASQ